MGLLESIGRGTFQLFNGMGRAAYFATHLPGQIGTLQEALREVRESSELSEPGWTPLLATGESALMAALDLQDIRDASHYYFLRDPLFRRGVQLIRDYTFGRGISWRAADPRVAEVLSSFWNDTRNKRIISRADAQWRLSERLQLDGEIFFAYFTNRHNGSVVLRLIPVGEVTDIITHPEDAATTLYYKREWTRHEMNWHSMTPTSASRRVDYIPDVGNLSGDYSSYSTVGSGDVLVCASQLKVNTHGKRGIPLHFVAIPWAKATRGFMEDRVTLTLAQAVFAFRQKIKGNARAMARILSDWQSINDTNRYATGGKERREGGQTLIENEASDLQPFEASTGAGQAYQDVRMLRQQVAAGMGITEPDLTGDALAGTYSTINSMAAAMRKGFESQQQLWGDAIGDIFTFVIKMAQEFGDLPKSVDTTVEVDMPPITTRDLSTTLTAISQILSAQTTAGTTILTDRRLAIEILMALGETDIEAALAEIESEKAKKGKAPPSAAPSGNNGAAQPETFGISEPVEFHSRGDPEDVSSTLGLERAISRLIAEVKGQNVRLDVIETLVQRVAEAEQEM